MDFLSAAERLSAIDRKAVAFIPDRCLHTMDKYVACEACYQICPVEAITPGKPPVFQQDSCQSCLACLPVCPVGAYTAEDALPALMKCAVRIEESQIELACVAHPDIEEGPEDSTVVVRIRGCLAGIGTGGLLSLFALGKKKVQLRLDTCHDCPLGGLQPQIMRIVEEVSAYLSVWDTGQEIELIENIDADALHERPVWDAENPPLSRRDLFKFASQRGQLMAARAINADKGSGGQQRPAPDRLRMIASISHLPEAKNNISLNSGYAALEVSEDCTACSACVRVCPTGALEYEQIEFKTFRLKFKPDHCIGCQMCQQVCVPDAITINHQTDFETVFVGEEPVLLAEGEIARCERCSTVMAKKPGVLLCPICQHRRENPFGGALPERLLRLMKNQPKKEAKP